MKPNRAHWLAPIIALVAACGGGNAAQPPAATAPSGSGASATQATPASSAAAPGPNVSAAPSTVAPTAAASPLTAAEIRALLAATDRSDADRKVDAVRHPDQLLAFMGVGPGMRVADLGAGGGYTTELLARTVGPTGNVYSQNDPVLVKKFMDKPFTERLSRPANKNVVRVERSFDDPLPTEARNLDLVVNYIFYHDVVWIGADRDKMNKAIFAALKPGGTYVIVDASAKAGDGTKDAKTLHRIDESVVKDEVTKAGFTLAGSADFLRNPKDTRDWNSSPRAAGAKVGTEDRFVLKFVKP
jgi:predicted methyltransferase